jgi:hypothetical protein
MAQITREASAPIADGETASAADVENEFVKIFAQINGGLDNTNLAAAAGIVGTKIANTTITAGNIVSSTLTTTQMAASAVTKMSISTADNNGAMTASTSLVDVPGISSITLTPGSTSDIVVCELQITWDSSGSGSAATYDFGFNIDDGTTNDVVIGRKTDSETIPQTFRFKHVMTAVAASSTVYKARYKLVSGATGDFDSGTLEYNTLFSVMILPIK